MSQHVSSSILGIRGIWKPILKLFLLLLQLIPQWLKFDANANPPAYVAEGDGVSISITTSPSLQALQEIMSIEGRDH